MILIKSLFRLISLSIKLVFLPMKILQTGMTIVTCIVPLLAVVGVIGAIVWFVLIR